MKSILTLILLTLLIHGSVQAQSLVGRWQLKKSSSCLESQLPGDSSTNALLQEMKSQGKPASANILEFKDNGTGSESLSVLSSRKNYNPKGFLYRYAGGMIYLLDKKSRTLIEEFQAEINDSGELILSNNQRPCETSLWVRIE